MSREPHRALARTDEDRCPARLVAELVVNRRRRYALYYLAKHSGRVSVEELARQVAAWEHSTTSDEVTVAHAEAVYSSLRRNHLPYLDARGLVTYDSYSDRVTGQVDDPTVKLYVANDPRTTVAWHKVYLALTVVSTVLLGLTQIGVPPFGGLGAVATAALIVALFAVASVGYWYDVYRWRRRTEEDPPDFLLSVDEELSNEEREGCYDEDNRSG